MMVTPFKNDPFSIVAKAYSNLYDKPYEAWYGQHTDEKEGEHENEYGYTSFPFDGGIPEVVIYTEHNINIQVETFAHELAHVAVGIEHQHDEVWEEAFVKIFDEYNRIFDEMFGGEDE